MGIGNLKNPKPCTCISKYRQYVSPVGYYCFTCERQIDACRCTCLCFCVDCDVKRDINFDTCHFRYHRPQHKEPRHRPPPLLSVRPESPPMPPPHRKSLVLMRP